MKKKNEITQFNAKKVLTKSKLNQIKGGQSSSIIIEDIAGF
ncbi:MAG: ComC/BlpC family leader-containing pheromone/bacteriocin [Crocinitomix sp.]|nr:ComC/BlpC family leader-containing pheromone/bacteriocin [Crocinitomix sp.]